MIKLSHSKKKIYNELINLGLRKGMYVNLKCSYTSIGNLEGGPMSLIDIILDIIKEDGLLVTDSFVPSYKIYSKDLIKNRVNHHTKSYAGLIANIILKHKNCHRSFHPIQKFSLIGNLASYLAKHHDKHSYAYNILKIMSEEKNSFNLRIGPDNKVLGVGTTHVATGILNIKKYEPRLGVYFENSENNYEFFERNWIGICSNTLIKLNNFYEENENIILNRAHLGNTTALLTSMSQTLNEELKLFNKDINNLSCGNKYCFDCFTLKHNYEKKASFLIRNFFNLKLKNILYLFLKNLSLQPTQDLKLFK
jgi:aminoglycoside N3'-acetyltransferase